MNIILGIIITVMGLMILIPALISGSAGSIVAGMIFTLMGIYLITSSILDAKKALSEIEESSVDRSESVVDKIGGVNNIDINLSKYGDRSQLIILKDKSIHIGYNKYETEKILNFDSIIRLEIRVNKATEGTAYQSSTNYYKEIIESIIVYIHTTDSTEELIFRYSSYETNQAQEKYNEILKGLNRFKAMLDNTLDIDDLHNKSTIDIKEKSIPQQIKEYKELLDIDAITKEEFDKKKKQLLGI